MSKRIIFITGTRADYGKLKPLISETSKNRIFEVSVFVTGMHMLESYGYTLNEVKKDFPNIIYTFVNQNNKNQLDEILSKTILGLADYVREINPKLIIIHGDRVEALAGAIVGSLNHILVAHIEGGEISGTIDDSIRHAITKFSHIHFVANSESKQRVLNMGESPNTVFEIGSPDFEVMFSKQLPTLDDARTRYSIPFEEYSIVMFHPVTSELANLRNDATELVDFINESKGNYIIIKPNNDPGTEMIQEVYEKKLDFSKCRYFPSIRFEYFITLLKNAEMIIGNSSAGIREAPYFGIPTLNIGTRQKGRSKNSDIYNLKAEKGILLSTFNEIRRVKRVSVSQEFNSDSKEKSSKRFIDILNQDNLWRINVQKTFNDNFEN